MDTKDGRRNCSSHYVWLVGGKCNFYAKRELPSRNKNENIAKDIASMANNGGVLLYGVAEDDHE